ASEQELLMRRLDGGAIEGLNLQEGVYTIDVRRRNDSADYQLSWRPASAPPANHNELEPNDTRDTATVLGAQAEARGYLGVQDLDYFRFEVEDAAQLYRLQAVGEGITRVSVYSGGGTLIARESG